MDKIAFLFSGQGSQYIGMCKDLSKKSKAAKRTFEEASEVLGFDMEKLCTNGTKEEICKTENAQVSILTLSIAQVRAYMEQIGRKPQILAGHSLGEYAALVFSGAIKFEEALKIVRLRGIFMSKAGSLKKGTMATIRNFDENIVQDEIGKIKSKGFIICISNYNARNNVVISGEVKAVELAKKALEAKGAEVIDLNVSSAFHSPIMEAASEDLKSELEKIDFKDFNYTVLSNVTAMPYKDRSDIVELLTKQITSPVQWTNIMKYLENNDINLAIEFGPKATLRNLIRNNMANIKAYSYDKEEDKKELQAKLMKKYTIISRSLGLAVAVKNNNFNADEYQRYVIDPYRKIEKLKTELEMNGKEPNIEEMNMAVEMLKSVFNTKGVSLEEQRKRFNILFDETDTRQYFKDFEI